MNSITALPEHISGGPSPASYFPIVNNSRIEYSIRTKPQERKLSCTPGPGAYMNRTDSRGSNVISKYRKVRGYLIKAPITRKMKMIRICKIPGPGDYQVSSYAELLSDFKKTPSTIFQRARRFHTMVK